MATASASGMNILGALDLDAFEPKEQESLLLALSDLVFRSSLVRMIEEMDDKTKDEFAALAKRGASEDEMAAFLKQRVPQAGRAVRDTLEEITRDITALDIPAAA